MTDKAVSEVEREIREIDELFRSFAELLATERDSKPSLIEMSALASTLHSFYNGLENIFSRIAKEIDGFVPAGEDSHRALLRQMTEPNPEREAVLTAAAATDAAEYLSFRHYYRHGYTQHLNWEKLEKLTSPLPTVWQQLKAEVRAFLADLADAAPEGDATPGDTAEG